MHLENPVSQCQIANFPQLFLLSKNQQCLWTADNILNGTSGEAEEKKENTRKHLFLLLNKNKQYKAESWAEKSFSIQLTFCLLHNLVHTHWSRAGGWIRVLLLCGVNRLSLRESCQFSGLVSGRDRRTICGGTALVSTSALVWLLCVIHCTWGNLAEHKSPRKGRQTRAPICYEERWRPKQLQYVGIHIVFWSLEEYFHLLIPSSQLLFHRLLSSSPVKLLKERWKELFWYCSWYLNWGF